VTSVGELVILTFLFDFLRVKLRASVVVFFVLLFPDLADGLQPNALVKQSTLGRNHRHQVIPGLNK
jgi:hypothetical protein